ncbi:MAG TPA: hypothetical protein VF610_13585 [Segetibacter sp.]
MPLKLVDEQRRKIFLEDVEKLNFRFPTVEISKSCKVDKSYVSKVMKGDIPLSDNFFETFKKVYQSQLKGEKNDLNELPDEPVTQQLKEEKLTYKLSDNDKYVEQIVDTNNLLKRNNEALLKLVDSNIQLADTNNIITRLLETTVNDRNQNQGGVDAIVADLLELIAEVASGETKYKSTQEAFASISKRFHGIALNGS